MGADAFVLTLERRFRAMGSTVHVLLVDGSPRLLDQAEQRLEELEQRWSRFRPDSELNRLNAGAGSLQPVSDDTALLVRRAVDGWHLTGGLYDPTVLGDVRRAGYDRTLAEVLRAPAEGDDLRHIGCDGVSVVDAADGPHVFLPAAVGIDPGGIGKGLAADLVAAELVEAGASGALVNVGGDLSVAGHGPSGGAWVITVDGPRVDDPPVSVVRLEAGGVATSTTARRRWAVGGEERHHLVDPRTGAPARTGRTQVTVLAAAAWQAEVLCKAVLLAADWHSVLPAGAAALVVADDGTTQVGGAITSGAAG